MRQWQDYRDGRIEPLRESLGDSIWSTFSEDSDRGFPPDPFLMESRPPSSSPALDVWDPSPTFGHTTRERTFETLPAESFLRQDYVEGRVFPHHVPPPNFLGPSEHVVQADLLRMGPQITDEYLREQLNELRSSSHITMENGNEMQVHTANRDSNIRGFNPTNMIIPWEDPDYFIQDPPIGRGGRVRYPGSRRAEEHPVEEERDPDLEYWDF